MVDFNGTSKLRRRKRAKLVREVYGAGELRAVKSKVVCVMFLFVVV